MSENATWRVYLPEWLIVYSSNAFTEQGKAECLQHFADRYAGRVREEDWRVVCSVTSKPGGWPYLLELRLPNLRGEFKDRQDVPVYDAEDAYLVRRGSAEEQALLEYGKKMLKV
jgi:hypothetical protein